MPQWCRDHTGNVDTMGITMFYVILTVISVITLYTSYEMCCSEIFQWFSNNMVCSEMLEYPVLSSFISDVKWCGT